MCTVTIVPLVRSADGDPVAPVARAFRMACNRDESRQRPPALPPEMRRFGPRRAILPIDPLGGGTWVAVNDAGLAMTLLNAHPPGTPDDAPRRRTGRSRGLIIPDLLDCDGVASAVERAASIAAADYPPFRLILVDETMLGDVYSDGRAVRRRVSDRSPHPVMFASSGLGDELVDVPRRALFEEMFRNDADWVATQYVYQRHSWPDRRHLSVCMSRPEARTVSMTVITVRPETVELQYFGAPPDQPVAPITLSLARGGKPA